MKTPNFHDVEQISALLDGRLSQAETARLESRLKVEPGLKAVMDELSETRGLLRRLPQRRAPRNFTLTPKMAGLRPPTPRAFPALRFATVMATFLLVFSLATNALAPAFRQAAQAPMYGMGGGGGGIDEPEVMSAATEAPATEAAAAEPPAAGLVPLPTNAATVQAQDSNRVADTPTPDASFKSTGPVEQPPGAELQPAAPTEPRQGQAQSLPIPQGWILALLVIALVSGGLAWLLHWASERSWRAKMK